MALTSLGSCEDLVVDGITVAGVHLRGRDHMIRQETKKVGKSQ
jgi:hypothetical protein